MRRLEESCYFFQDLFRGPFVQGPVLLVSECNILYFSSESHHSFTCPSQTLAVTRVLPLFVSQIHTEAPRSQKLCTFFKSNPNITSLKPSQSNTSSPHSSTSIPHPPQPPSPDHPANSSPHSKAPQPPSSPRKVPRGRNL